MILLLLAPAACKRQKAAESRLDSFPVRVTPAARRDIEETIVLVGSIKAKDEAALFSRVPGKLQRNVLKEGDPVRKGAAVALVERDEVGVRFEPAPVPSTLDGVVARLYLDQGQNVTPQTPVALVVDPSQILARVDVPERFAGRVRLGLALRVKVDAYPDRAFPGTVTRVSPVVDPATRSTLVEARIEDAEGRLRPGMFGEITLVLARAGGVLAVPAESVTDGLGWALFVVQDGRAVKREVELGVRSDAFVEIRKGLAPGESVVTFGLFGLKDGSPVEILAP
ncbi:MAG: hypothetical protein A2X36_09770 [Elusimicrobia bacterium GWA2_69_24]|nr:MAG: hypothetical protein A2X36_09770 [Elusimicrobia bacterium GWA2_69_24]